MDAAGDGLEEHTDSWGAQGQTRVFKLRVLRRLAAAAVSRTFTLWREGV